MSDGMEFDTRTWGDAAAKGELVQSLVHLKRISVITLKLINSVRQGDDAKYTKAIDEFYEAHRLLDEFTDKVGNMIEAKVE